MNNQFSDCLKKGKIKNFSRGQFLTAKELNLAKDDLASARKSFDDKNFRWAIIQTYYSMFHSARALLYNKNYREHSHFCLIEAMKELYAKERKISLAILESFIKAKQLRESADYYGNFSEINAKNLLQDAKNFINQAEKIIK